MTVTSFLQCTLKCYYPDQNSISYPSSSSSPELRGCKNSTLPILIGEIRYLYFISLYKCFLYKATSDNLFVLYEAIKKPVTAQEKRNSLKANFIFDFYRHKLMFCLLFGSSVQISMPSCIFSYLWI